MNESGSTPYCGAPPVPTEIWSRRNDDPILIATLALLCILLWNLTALEDQQLGGLIMWIPTGAVFLIATLLMMYSTLRKQDAEAARNRQRSDLNGAYSAPSLRNSNQG